MKDIDILDHLLTDASIVNIIENRIWTTWLPEKSDLPAITCNYVSVVPEITFTEDTLQGRELTTINIWAKNKTDAIDLQKAVLAKMSGFAQRQSMTDLTDDEQGIYRYAIDYSIFG